MYWFKLKIYTGALLFFSYTGGYYDSRDVCERQSEKAVAFFLYQDSYSVEGGECHMGPIEAWGIDNG